MIKYRAYKFRLYPNKEQKEYFAKAFGSVRFLYNQMLAEKISLYEQYGHDLVLLKTHKPRTYTEIKRENPWMYEIDNNALANVPIHLIEAFNRFYKNHKGFPKFKCKKSGENTYTTCPYHNNIRIIGKEIKLPRVGLVKLVQHRQIPEDCKMKSCIISMSPANKYYISIITECECEPQKPILDKSKSLGLDYSNPHFYVDSQGVEADYPRFFRISEKRIAQEQRRLAHMTQGGKNYEKQRKRLAVVYGHVANQRRDWLHKESKRLADDWDYIFLEDINLRCMAQSLSLGKSISDNGFGMFRKFLQYKMEDRGKVLYKISRWFPSTKACSECGMIHDLRLSDRKWTCECGAHHNRDINAAINIRNEGLRAIE